MRLDHDSHGRVCSLLRCINASEELEFSREEVDQLLADFLAAAKAKVVVAAHAEVIVPTRSCFVWQCTHPGDCDSQHDEGPWSLALS